MNFIDTEDKRIGCLSACVGSIMGLTPGVLPNWTKSDASFFHDQWPYELNRWLLPYGLQGLVIEAETIDDQPWLMPRGLHIRSGKAVNEPTEEHAVVYCDDIMIHDPTAPRNGIKTFSSAIVLVPLDPARFSVPTLYRDMMGQP